MHEWVFILGVRVTAVSVIPNGRRMRLETSASYVVIPARNERA